VALRSIWACETAAANQPMRMAAPSNPKFKALIQRKDRTGESGRLVRLAIT
jgi:hypothetical protein